MRPLDGTRVLDLTRFLAGPHCTMVLGGLGAEVIKIEPPGRGDFYRDRAPYGGPKGCAREKLTDEDIGIGLIHRARNKKGVTLDLHSEQGRALFARLCEKSDVVVENYSPGVMEDMGFSYESLRRLNPRIILCSISGFGQSGPLKSRRAYDPIIQAMSGLMAITGFAGQPPVRSGAAIADTATPLLAVIGILSALMRRKETGLGDWVDVAMLDSLMFLMPEVIEHFQGGTLSVPMENRHPGGVPFNSFQASDGYVFIAVATEIEWTNLLGAMGRKELIDDPRFARLPDRRRHLDEVEALIGNWVKARTRDQVVDILQANKIASGPVLSLAESLDSAHLRAREMLVPLEHPNGEEIPGVVGLGMPVRFAQDQVPLDRRAPAQGEHNSEIFGDLLDLDPEQLAALKAQNVI